MELRQYAEQQLERLQRSWDQVLAVGDVEAVHQLRVASRRLEEPLELCRPWASGKPIDRAVQRLERLRKAFRRVRELDVLQASLRESEGAGLSAADFELLDTGLTAERERHWRQALQKTAPSDGHAIARAVSRVLDKLKPVGDTMMEPWRDRAAEWTAARADDILKNAPPDGKGLDLHRVRVKLKQLRYAVELKQALADEKCEDLIRSFKAAQDRLGGWNDELQAAAYLSKMARRRRMMVERPAFAARLLKVAAGRLKRSQGLAELFLADWPALRSDLSELAKADE